MMRMLLLGLALMGMGCAHSAGPVLFRVAPTEVRTAFNPFALASVKLTGVLRNTAKRDPMVAPAGFGLTTVHKLTCNGKRLNGFRLETAFQAFPPYHFIALKPGQESTFSIRIVGYEWKSGFRLGEIWYRIDSPGRCQVQFAYSTSRIESPGWTALSNEVTIEISR